VLVVVDARLGRKITGIGYYSLELLAALGRLGSDEVRPLCRPAHRRRFRQMNLKPIVMASLRASATLEHIRNEASLVHAPNFASSDLPGEPRIATIHDLGFVRFPELHPPGFAEKLDNLIRASLPYTPLYLCDSDSTAADFVDHYGVSADRARTVHLGVSERFTPGAPSPRLQRLLKKAGVDRPFILHIGSMVPRKDVLTLARAYAEILERGHEVDLLLVGTKSLRWASDWPALKEWQRDNPDVARTMTVLDYVPDSLLPDLYRAATVYASTAVWEGFGLTILEALASGCPAVAADVGAVPEVAGNAIFYGHPRDPTSFAEALDEALRRDPDRIARGRDRAAMFQWQKTARETLIAYRDAVSVAR
jgi:glycosyltransferase involved in cell wall biosynthesis